MPRPEGTYMQAYMRQRSNLNVNYNCRHDPFLKYCVCSVIAKGRMNSFEMNGFAVFVIIVAHAMVVWRFEICVY